MKKAIAAMLLLVAIVVTGCSQDTAKPVASFHEQFKKSGIEALEIDTHFFEDQLKMITEQIDYHEFANRVSKETPKLREILERLETMDVPEEQKANIFVYKKALTTMIDIRESIVENTGNNNKELVLKSCEKYKIASQIASDIGAEIVRISEE